MKLFSKIIKGTLLIILAIGVFCLNANKQVGGQSIVRLQVQNEPILQNPNKMKLFSKIIKGIVLAVIAVNVFWLTPGIKTYNTGSYFVNTAFAEEKTNTLPKIGTDSSAALSTAEEGIAKDIKEDANSALKNTPSPEAATTSVSGDGTSTSTDTTKAPAKPFELSPKIIETIKTASSYIFTFFNPLIYFFTKHIGNLLNNDYIYGGKMGEMLHTIWVICRNIVNIVFVLILLFLALKHIFSEDESTDLKKVLPKFVIMLIAINFSWLACKVVLDAANVATNVVFAIPSGAKGMATLVDTTSTSKTSTDTKSLTDAKNTNECQMLDANGKPLTSGAGAQTNKKCMITQIWIPADSTEVQHMTNANCLGKDGKTGKDSDIAKGYGTSYKNGKAVEGAEFTRRTTYCWENLQIDKFSRTNAAYHLTYGMMGVQNLGRAPTDSSISQVGIGTLFALVLQVVYVIAFACLFIALVIRVAALWIFIATSPFLVLMYYLKDFQFSGSEKFSHTEFIKWAFAPAKVAGVWALGFLMITTGQTGTEQLFATLDEQGSITSKVFSVSSLFMGMDSLQSFMWLIMTVGIIWIGTFAIFADLKVVSAITEKVNQYGKDVATLVAESPKWAPIMPMLDKGGKLKFGSWEKDYKNLMPKGLLEKIREGYIGRRPEDGLIEAQRSLKKSKNSTNLKNLQNSDFNDSKQLYNALISGSDGHITHEDLEKMNPTELTKMLRDSGVEEDRAEKISKQIIEHAKKDTSDEKETPSAAGQTPALTEEAIRDGVRKALQEQPVKISELPEAQQTQLTKKAEELMKTKGLGNKEAVTKAIEELRKQPEFETKFSKLPQQPAGTTGAGGAAPTGSGAPPTSPNPPPPHR